MIKRLTKVEDNKLDIVTFDQLNKRFEKFSDIETIEVLRESFLPKIEGFTLLVE